MRDFWPQLFFFIIINLVSVNAWANECVVDRLVHDKTFQVQTPTRRIVIVGWMHLPTSLLEQNINAILPIVQALKANQTCDQIDELVGEDLKRNEAYIDSARMAYDKMREFLPLKNGTAIASEASPEELAEGNDNPDNLLSDRFSVKVSMLFDLFKKHCPALTPKLNILELLMIEPDRALRANQIKKHFKIDFIGVDDLPLRKKLFANISPIFNGLHIDAEDLTPAAKSRFHAMNDHFIARLEVPTKSETDQALALIKSSSEKMRMEQWVENLNLVASISRERDEKIVERLFATPNDTILLIGDAHVEDLHQRFEKQCLTAF